MPSAIGVVCLGVNQTYTNALGQSVKIVKRKVRPSGWRTRTRLWLHYFVDSNGQFYWPNGVAIKGKVGNLPKLSLRNIVT